jgi:hypothetical protein
LSFEFFISSYFLASHGLIFTAASEGHTEIVKFFEQKMKFDISYPKHAPLLAAVEGGHLKTAEAMLENYSMIPKCVVVFVCLVLF